MSIPRLTLVLHGVAKCALPIAYGWEKRRESRAVGGSENLEERGGGSSSDPKIYYQRSLDTRIHKTDIQFWAVLGIRGCKEKIKTAISMLLLRSVFYVFLAKIFFFNFLNIL